jgi:hypothetical protein
MPGRMTGYAIADSLKVGVRDAGHQIRDTCMTEGTIVVMGGKNGRILVSPRIVTGYTYSRSCYISRSLVIDDGVKTVMTIQTVGRGGHQSDGVDNFLT